MVITASRARMFTGRGFIPGMPVQTSQTRLFGSFVSWYDVGQSQKSFFPVFNGTWISRPMLISVINILFASRIKAGYGRGRTD